MPTLAENKRARTDYHLIDKYEAGIVLSGAEVKSAKNGNVKLQGSYLTVAGAELWLIGCHIGRYAPAGPQPDYDPTRRRKLLVRKRELVTLIGKTHEKGLTLVPIQLYTLGRNIKLSFAVARGKKEYDKRADIKKRELGREVHRIMKGER